MSKRLVPCSLAVLGMFAAAMVARAATENSFTPGTIKSIDAEKKTFVMVRTMEDKSTRDISVKTTDQTTYSKDGGEITFADLKVGQTIVCENQKVTSTERIAVVVKVTADAPTETPAQPKP